MPGCDSIHPFIHSLTHPGSLSLCQLLFIKYYRITTCASQHVKLEKQIAALSAQGLAFSSSPVKTSFTFLSQVFPTLLRLDFCCEIWNAIIFNYFCVCLPDHKVNTWGEDWVIAFPKLRYALRLLQVMLMKSQVPFLSIYLYKII